MSCQQGFEMIILFWKGQEEWNWVCDLCRNVRFQVSINLTWARPDASPFVNGSSYQHSVCTVLDREKYSTLHTCGTKILPCEEDRMVVVLSVLGVAALLRVGPSAHLLQAARWVTTLDQADGLEKKQTRKKALKF